MEYSSEQLAEIENFAYLYLERHEIAIITGANASDMADEQSPAYLSFQKGRLRCKAEYNSAVINLRKQLSSPAMAIEQKIAEAAYLNDLRT